MNELSKAAPFFSKGGDEFKIVFSLKVSDQLKVQLQMLQFMQREEEKHHEEKCYICIIFF